jgi:Xaa-Pro aminopeptidase
MTSPLNQVRAFMAENELDAFLITDDHNRRYLTGFTGSSGNLLITKESQYIVTDFRYFEQVRCQAPSWQLWKQKMTLHKATSDLLLELKPKKIGFESKILTVHDWEFYREKGVQNIRWFSTVDLLARIRAIKNAQEISAITEAQSITDQAATYLPRLIEPGKSERQVAWELEKQLRDLGTDRLAFEIIVASGPNAALPHYRPGNRVIQENEMVLVDFGATWNGYHSDMTRTYFTGEPTEQYKQIYHIVLQALEKVQQTIKAGFGLKAGDAVARELIKSAGYGDYFGHGLGHGLGLQIHEMPRMSYRTVDREKLVANHVVTIEPGIYIPEWGGIRIEDLVLITQDGVEILTSTSKDIDLWRKAR